MHEAMKSNLVVKDEEIGTLLCEADEALRTQAADLQAIAGNQQASCRPRYTECSAACVHWLSNRLRLTVSLASSCSSLSPSSAVLAALEPQQHAVSFAK